MAKKTVVTVIDLSATNADALRQALSPYMDHARKVRGRRRSNTAPGARRQTDGTSKAARRWALAAGIDVPASGRVPETILAPWKAAGAPA